MWRLLALTTIVVSFTAFGCSGGKIGSLGAPQPNVTVGSGVCTPDIDSLEATVFTSCTSASCHNVTDQAAGLRLEGDGLADQLVGAGAGTCDGWTRVVPGDPDSSLLVAKVSGNPPCG